VANVLFHPEAQAEYVDALNRYRTQSERAANRFEAEIERILGSIPAYPEMYPRYDSEHRFALLRRYPYSVVYQVHEGRTYVVAVAHSSREPGYWQGRA